MKLYAYILAFACICILYLNRQAPKSSPSTPAFKQSEAPTPSDSPLDVASEALPSSLPKIGDSGYCGAKMPANFRRPGISQLINRAPGADGNAARRLYNQRQEMEEHLDTWESKMPESPYPHVWRGFLTLKQGQKGEALEHFQEAYGRLPKDPILALLIGNLQTHSIDLESAIAMLEVYTKHYPADLPKQQELARLQTQYEIQADYQNIEYQGLNLLYPPQTSHLDWESFVVWIDERLEAAADFTGTEKRTHLTIVAFEGKAELLATTCTPTWTGGVYDGSIKLALRNLQSLPHRTTTAHETLHAQLSHTLAGPIPAWFSEGMAQAFAKEEKYARRSWQKMVQHQTYIPFSSLGDSFLEFTGTDDARLAYHQGLAMVLWIQEFEGDQGLHRLVQTIKDSKSRHTDLMQAIERDYEASDFLDFVATLVQD